MKKIITLIIVLFSFNGFSQDTYNSLLQKYVDDAGNVNYADFIQEKSKLESYLTTLENTTPKLEWSLNKKKAFWINVYNAYTLKLILDNYPLKSITNINQHGKHAWKIPFVKVGGKTYTLDHVEHGILRKEFSDPRIHVGVNCASISCPKLANVAFTEDNIENLLETLMKDFINDSSRNVISEKKLELSEIFNWFKGDFIKGRKLVDYLNLYSDVEISKKAKIRFLTYNWGLNQQ